VGTKMRFMAGAMIAVLIFPMTALASNDAVGWQSYDQAQPFRQQLDAMIDEYETLLVSAPVHEELISALEIAREQLAALPDGEFEAVDPALAQAVQELRSAIQDLQFMPRDPGYPPSTRTPGLPDAPYPEVSWLFAIEAFTGNQEQPDEDIEESRGGLCSYANNPSPNDQFLMLNATLVAEALKETAARICGLAEDFPVPASLIGLACIVTDIAYIVAKGITENEAMCSSFMTDAETTASYRRAGHLHTDLADARSDLLDDIGNAQIAINAEVDVNELLLFDLDNDLLFHDLNFTARADWIMALLGAQEQLLIDFRAENLRSHIEQRLSESDHKSIAFFLLPEAHGGKLEVVRMIVEETIYDAGATGADVRQARRIFQMANTAIAHGAFERAYELLGRAYRGALR
jgi:hypothetical protein